MLLSLLPAHLLVKLCVRLAAEPSAYASYSYLYFAGGMALCALTYKVLAYCTGSDGSTTVRTAYEYQRLHELDTEGVRYDQVEARKGYPIDGVHTLCEDRTRSIPLPALAAVHV